jgi:Protein of unknown function (DUF3667)
MTQVADAPGVCVSCGSPVTGRFCSTCGEEVLDPHTLTVRHFLVDTVADEMLHFDAKVWRTVRALLFRRGLLSEEYCRGRRRPYINPVRLLVIAILAYALLTRAGLLVSLQLGTVALSIAPTKVSEGTTIEDTVARLDRFHLLGPVLAATARRVDLRAPAVHDAFHQKLERISEPLSFTNVVLLALALYVLFRRRRAFLVDHAVFSMHIVSFVLCSSLLLRPSVWLMSVQPAVGLFLLFGVVLWQFASLTAAIGRFYFARRGGRVRRLAGSMTAATAIYLLNSVFVTAVQSVGAAFALWSL